MEYAEQVLSLGVKRIILGTVALENPAMVSEAIRRWGDAVAVGIDAHNGMAATHGWLETSDTPAVDLARRLEDIGVSRFIYTDISRDGTLTEPNFAAVRQFVEDIPARVIASGGVATSTTYVLWTRSASRRLSLAGPFTPGRSTWPRR